MRSNFLAFWLSCCMYIRVTSLITLNLPELLIEITVIRI